MDLFTRVPVDAPIQSFCVNLQNCSHLVLALLCLKCIFLRHSKTIVAAQFAMQATVLELCIKCDLRLLFARGREKPALWQNYATAKISMCVVRRAIVFRDGTGVDNFNK